jgi:hypothetical protein
VLSRLNMLDLFLYAADPGAERHGLKHLLVRLRAEAGQGQGKRRRLQSSHDLVALGCRLMAQAEAKQQTPRQRAVAYRNGLIIALLAARPLRLRNFVALSLGRQLLRAGDGWRLLVPVTRPRPGARSTCPSRRLWWQHSSATLPC